MIKKGNKIYCKLKRKIFKFSAGIILKAKKKQEMPPRKAVSSNINQRKCVLCESVITVYNYNYTVIVYGIQCTVKGWCQTLRNIRMSWREEVVEWWVGKREGWRVSEWDRKKNRGREWGVKRKIEEEGKLWRCWGGDKQRWGIGNHVHRPRVWYRRFILPAVL